MAVREYIGARYVPKFSDLNGGVWDNTYSYEALTIVKYGNDYYTSRIPVPVGVNILNTTYWVKTGDYNGAIADLQNEINALVRRPRKFILIGDSFGYGITPPSYDANNGVGWIKNFINSVGDLYDVYYPNIALLPGTAGFSSSLPFETMLDSLDATIDDKLSITDIIVFGGTNDSTSLVPDPSVLEPAIKSFMEDATAKYPNARVKIGCLTSNVRRISAEVAPYYKLCTKYGAEYVSDSLMLYANPTYWAGDNIHLTQAGYAYYTEYVNNLILSGHCDYRFEYGFNVTLEAGFYTLNSVNIAGTVRYTNNSYNVSLFDAATYADFMLNFAKVNAAQNLKFGTIDKIVRLPYSLRSLGGGTGYRYAYSGTVGHDIQPTRSFGYYIDPADNSLHINVGAPYNDIGIGDNNILQYMNFSPYLANDIAF